MWSRAERPGGFLGNNPMSKTYPECPLYNHNTCKELHNPRLCAIVKKDKKCLKKKGKPKPRPKE